MRFHSCAVALALALSGAGAAYADNMPPAMGKPPAMQLPSTANPDQKVRKKERRKGWKPAYDCHRDVRTHRLYGEKVRHRHVGDNCEVREVRRVN